MSKINSTKKEIINLILTKCVEEDNILTITENDNPVVDLRRIQTGAEVSILGRAISELVDDNFGIDIDLLFTPYLGLLPILVSASINLNDSGLDINYCYAENAVIIGHEPDHSDKVIIIEPNLSIMSYEALNRIKFKSGSKNLGIITLLDSSDFCHQSRAIKETIEDSYGLEVFSLFSFSELRNLVYPKTNS